MHIERQFEVKAVWGRAHGVVSPSGSIKHLMAVLVGKSDESVFDRWAITRDQTPSITTV